MRRWISAQVGWSGRRCLQISARSSAVNFSYFFRGMPHCGVLHCGVLGCGMLGRGVLDVVLRDCGVLGWLCSVSSMFEDKMCCSRYFIMKCNNDGRLSLDTCNKC